MSIIRLLENLKNVRTSKAIIRKRKPIVNNEYFEIEWNHEFPGNQFKKIETKIPSFLISSGLVRKRY